MHFIQFINSFLFFFSGNRLTTSWHMASHKHALEKVEVTTKAKINGLILGIGSNRYVRFPFCEM